MKIFSMHFFLRTFMPQQYKASRTQQRIRVMVSLSTFFSLFLNKF